MQVELSKDEYDDLLKMRKEKKQRQLTDTIKGRIPNQFSRNHIGNWLVTLEPDLLEKILEMYNVPNNTVQVEVEPADWDVDDGPTTMAASPFAQPATTNGWSTND